MASNCDNGLCGCPLSNNCKRNKLMTEVKTLKREIKVAELELYDIFADVDTPCCSDNETNDEENEANNDQLLELESDKLESDKLESNKLKSDKPESDKLESGKPESTKPESATLDKDDENNDEGGSDDSSTDDNSSSDGSSSSDDDDEVQIFEPVQVCSFLIIHCLMLIF